MANINLATLPFSTVIRRPGAGAEQWNNGSEAVWEKDADDAYYRFTWAQLENLTLGGYNWTHFDNLVNGCIAKKQKLSFGVMVCYPWGDTGVGCVSFPEGGFGAYPLYLHKLMQAESVKDWRTGDTWTPNYNSPNYLARLLALYQALNAHIIAKGWEKVVQFIDNRGFGAWGEWNSSYTPTNNVSDYPPGTFPTIATFKKIIDIFTTGFPNFRLLNMIAVFDGNLLGNTMIPPEIGEYALQSRNNRGLLGWRRDQWGATDGYLSQYLENNNRVNKALIMERYKVAPITGEPMPSGNNMSDLLRQVLLYHATSFGDGNYGGISNLAEITENVKNASNACGYKLQIESGNFTPNGNALSITLNWKNGGIGPTYEDWQVILFLRNTTAQIVSTFKPELFLPAATASAVTDSSVFSVPAGTYPLAVKVIDPKGYRDPMPLYNAGRQADGSYNLGTVTIGTAPTPNVGPVVSAGSDITITLPVDTVKLVGSATDPDGSIAKVLWRKVSGSGVIATPNTNSTDITGLQEGTSVYEFTGTDNMNASKSDQITITVKPKPVPQPDKKIVDMLTTVETTYTTVYSDGTKEVFVK